MNKIVMIYDGITNSVFKGQILTPILKELEYTPHLSIYLISFENNNVTDKHIIELNNLHTHLKVFILKKTPFFLGYFSVLLASIQCKKIFSSLPSYILQTRGPIAGAIGQSLLTSKCTQFIMQARGLLAEEFLYSTQIDTPSWYKKIYSTIRYYQLAFFEKKTYEWRPLATTLYIFESVSPALQHYLQTHYAIKAHHFTIAANDIPEALTIQQKTIWNTIIRKKLTIDPNTTVFIYNGSCKPWQCFKETVDFFKQEFLKNHSIYLLILTTDINECRNIILQAHLPKHRYHLTTVPYNEIYHYLSAGNYGILLREQHIINWTSRPTKALEYKAAHLTIIHNNTIAYLKSENHNVQYQ